MDDAFYDGHHEPDAHMQDEDVPFTSTISLATRDQKAGGSAGPMQPAPPPPPRQRSYFIIRSNSMHNLQISQKEGAWCTQRFNEPKLDEAFARRGSEVRLLFSATGTYAFQGWATMTTKIASLGRVVLWEYGKTYGPPFGCHWKCIFNLTESDHIISGLTNPWNNNMPILNASDGQELPQEIGDLIVQRMEQQAAAEGVPPPPAPPPPMPLSQRFAGPRPPFGGRGGYGRGPPPFESGHGMMGGRDMGGGRLGGLESREEKNELLDMSYEDYLQVFERVRQKMLDIKEIKPAFVPPPQHYVQPYQPVVAAVVRPAGMGGMNQSGMGGMNQSGYVGMQAGGAGNSAGGAAGGMGAGGRPYTEAEYIAVTLNHFRSQGKPPPSEDFIRQHYRQSIMRS